MQFKMKKIINFHGKCHAKNLCKIQFLFPFNFCLKYSETQRWKI